MNRPNPYPGPRPLTRDDRIYGRTVELRRLSNLLISERIVLLYSPSGAGKTSLLQAGLLPRLERGGFRVLGPIRPGIAAGAGGRSTENRYLAATADALRDDTRLPLDLPPGAALADYLAALGPPPPKPFRLGAQLERDKDAGPSSDPGRPERVWQADLLVFDQFEEVLLADEGDHPGRLAFFEQLGEVLRDRNRWALFAMREEHIAGLDPYRRPIPGQFSTTFRLEPLSVPQAIEAIRGPAEGAGVAFPEEVAAALATNLAGAARGAAAAGPADAMGSGQSARGAQRGWVEPVQLQVVCQQIWDKLEPDEAVIGEQHLDKIGSVDVALGEYYNRSVQEAAEKARLRERRLREWVDEKLITPSGARNQFLWERGPATVALDEAIDRLDKAHLVRAERRRDALWVELAHDRLVTPVRRANAEWLQKTLQPFQKRAQTWGQTRQPDLLLTGAALKAAEAWAGEPENRAELDERPVEAQFLLESQEAEQERRRGRRRRNALIAAAVVAALALAGWLVDARAQAERSSRQELSRRLGFDAVAVREREPITALLLAAAAHESWDTFEARSSLIAALSPEGLPAAIFEASTQPDDGTNALASASVSDAAPPVFSEQESLTAVAVSDDGGRMAAGAASGRIYIWDMATRQQVQVEALPGEVVVERLAYAPGGEILAAGDAKGMVWLYSVEAGRLASAGSFRAHDDLINSMTWGAGRALFTLGKNDLAAWRVGNGEAVELARRSAPEARALALRPGGSALITAHEDGRIAEWPVSRDGVPAEAPVAEYRGTPGTPRAIAAAETGSIAAGYERGLVLVWPGNEGAPGEFIVAGKQEGDITALQWGPGGKWVASAGRDHQVVVWDAAGGGALTRWRGHTADVNALASGVQASYVISAGDDGRAYAWLAPGVITESPLGVQVTGHQDEVWSVDFSPVPVGGASLVASAGKDGQVLLTNVENRSAGSLVLAEGLPPVRHVAFSLDGSRLAAADEAGQIRLWTLKDGAPESGPVVYAHGDGLISGLLFLEDALISAGIPDQSRLASQLNAWPLDRAGGAALAAADLPQLAIAMARDDRGRLWVLDHESTVTVWRWDSARRAFEQINQHPVRDHRGFEPYSLAVLGAGQLIALGGVDGRIALGVVDGPIARDAPTAVSIATMEGHSSRVGAVAFNPSGDLLASAGWDGQVRLWDVATRRQLGVPLRSVGLGISDVAFSADGRWLAVVSDDQTLMLYPATPEQWRKAACELAGRTLTREERDRYFDGRDPRVCASPEAGGVK